MICLNLLTTSVTDDDKQRTERALNSTRMLSNVARLKAIVLLKLYTHIMCMLASTKDNFQHLVRSYVEHTYSQHSCFIANFVNIESGLRAIVIAS